MITNNTPKVSCLMVTRGNINFIKTSYRSFKLQSYTNKELIIVFDKPNDELRQLVKEDASVVLVEVEPGLTLGELRNISVSNSSGEYVCQWDDDDLYSPERISFCMGILNSRKEIDAIFLSRWLLWWEKKKLLAISGYTYWEGSIIVKKSILVDVGYKPISRGEDTVLSQYLFQHKMCIAIDNTGLYCYRITGENTWDEPYFQNLFDGATKTFSSEEYESVFKMPCFVSLSEL